VVARNLSKSVCYTVVRKCGHRGSVLVNSVYVMDDAQCPPTGWFNNKSVPQATGIFCCNRRYRNAKY